GERRVPGDERRRPEHQRAITDAETRLGEQRSTQPVGRLRRKQPRCGEHRAKAPPELIGLGPRELDEPLEEIWRYCGGVARHWCPPSATARRIFFERALN